MGRKGYDWFYYFPISGSSSKNMENMEITSDFRQESHVHVFNHRSPNISGKQFWKYECRKFGLICYDWFVFLTFKNFLYIFQFRYPRKTIPMTDDEVRIKPGKKTYISNPIQPRLFRSSLLTKAIRLVPSIVLEGWCQPFQKPTLKPVKWNYSKLSVTSARR